MKCFSLRSLVLSFSLLQFVRASIRGLDSGSEDIDFGGQRSGRTSLRYGGSAGGQTKDPTPWTRRPTLALPTTPQPTPLPTYPAAPSPPTTATPTPLPTIPAALAPGTRPPTPGAAVPTPQPPTPLPTIISGDDTGSRTGDCKGGSPHWQEPMWAGKIQCETNNDCRGTLSNAICCMRNFCFCGHYRPGYAVQDCV